MTDMVVELGACYCSLKRERTGSTSKQEEAWRFLPSDGQGVVVLSDAVRRFKPGVSEGLLVEADVTQGSMTTLVRMSPDGWQAWQWRETDGSSHCYVERDYLSSEPSRDAPSLLRYRHYWTLEEDDGIRVWHPVGSRFCGFVEDVK